MKKEKKIYITMDMDWACNEVMLYCYRLIQELKIKVTINITNEVDCIREMRLDPDIELGIHPNFNPLLAGDSSNKMGSEGVVKTLKNFLPEAVTARSHSLVQSTPILNQLADNGILFELNQYIPPFPGVCLPPYRFLDKITRIPFIYEDDIALIEGKDYTAEYYLGEGFSMERVFNFHPIHIFLNTEKLDRYANSKQYQFDFNQLEKYRNTNIEEGTEVFFKKLIAEAKKQGYKFCCIKEWESVI